MVFSLPRKKYFSLEKPTQWSHNAHAREDQFSEKLWFWYFDVALNTFGSGAVKQSQSCHKGQPKAGKGWWGGGRGEGGGRLSKIPLIALVQTMISLLYFCPDTMNTE